MGLFNLFDSTSKETKEKVDKFKERLGYGDMDRIYSEYQHFLQDQEAVDYLNKTVEKPIENQKRLSKQEQSTEAQKRIDNLNRLNNLQGAVSELEKGDGDKMAALYLNDQQAYQAVMRHPEDRLDKSVVAKTRMKAITLLSGQLNKVNNETKQQYERNIETESKKAAKEFAVTKDVKNCRKALELVQGTNKKWNRNLVEEVMGYHQDALKNNPATASFMIAMATLPIEKETDGFSSSDVESRAYVIAELSEEHRAEIITGMKDFINYGDPEMAKMLVSYVNINSSYNNRNNRNNTLVGQKSQQVALEMLVDPTGFNILSENSVPRFVQKNNRNVVGDFYDVVINRMDFENETAMRSVVLPNMAGVDKFLTGYNTYNTQKEQPSDALNYSTLIATTKGGSLHLAGHIAGLLYNERLKDKYDPKQELSLEMSNDLTAFNNMAFAVLNGNTSSYNKKPVTELVKNVIRMEKLEDNKKPLEAMQDNFDENPRFAGQSFDMLVSLKKNSNYNNREAVSSIEEALKIEHRNALASRRDFKIKPEF
jgi:hypothetical protein